MASINTRSGKGAPLTNDEVDANFSNLNSDKAEKSSLAAVAISGSYLDLSAVPNIGDEARAAVSAAGDLSYDSVSGTFSYTERTDAQIRGLFSASGDLSYDSGTGTFSVNVPEGYGSADFDTDFSKKSTDDLSEGQGNLYYTDARVDARIGDGRLTVSGGTGLTGSGTFDANQSGNTSVTLDVDTTVIATQSYVDSEVSNLVQSAPSTMDTLNELASALGDDPNFATTISNEVGTKAKKSTTISSGSGLSGGGDLSSDRTISHADTSSQGSVNNSGGTVIQDVYLDGFGHVTNINSKNLSASDVGAEPSGSVSSHESAADPHSQYAKSASLASVATSGAYSDLSGTPSIPSSPSDIGLGNVPNSNNLSSFVNGPNYVDAGGARSAVESGNLSRIDGQNNFRIRFDSSTNWMEFTDQSNNREKIVTRDTYVDDLSGGTWLSDLSPGDIGALGANDKAADANKLDGFDSSEYQRIISSNQKNNLAAGWYTIATNYGNRAIAKFGIRDTDSGDHQSAIFYASHNYGRGNSLTLVHCSHYGGDPFRYIRIKEGGTYDGAMLQVYIDQSNNRVQAFIVGDNFQSSGWSIADWIPDGTDPGGGVDFSSLTNVAAQIDINEVQDGGISTTGPIYAGGDTTQYQVWHAGNDGSGSGLDADKLDGQHASAFLGVNDKAADANKLDGLNSSQFLRSDTSDTINGNLTLSGSADTTTLKVLKTLNSPDEPTAVLIASDADGTDDLAFEIRGNTDGGTVDTTDTLTSSDTTFGVFANGVTAIGYNNLGEDYANPNYALLGVNGSVYIADTLDVNGSLNVTGSVSGITPSEIGALQASDVDSAYGGIYTTKSASDVGYSAKSKSGRFGHLRGGLGLESVTFREALKDAANRGVRLPTLDEIEDEIVRGTGGGFDSHICWTCTPVPGRPGYVYAKLGTGEGTRYELPTNESQTAYSRYVANVDVPQISASDVGALGANDKAADADKLDGLNSSQFLRSDSDNSYVDFSNNEQTDYNTDGRLFWDKSTGLYIRSSNSNSDSPRLLWSGANVSAGSGIAISYGSEDEPTISVSGISSSGLKDVKVYNPGSHTWQNNGISKVRVIALAGGGGGGGADMKSYHDGTTSGGDGGIGAAATGVYDVSSESSVSINVGSGGSGGYGDSNGSGGGATSFGSFLTVSGGSGGRGAYAGESSSDGSNGGSTGETLAFALPFERSKSSGGSGARVQDSGTARGGNGGDGIIIIEEYE